MNEQKIEKTIWREKIKVFSNGEVYSLKTSEKYAIHITDQGYHKVSCSFNNQTKLFRLHRIVAECFVENPELKCVVNHKDGDPSNNNAYNLEWVTQKENSQHAIDTKLNDCCRSVHQFSKEGEYIRTWPSISSAARSVDVNSRNIENACKTFGACRGFVWEYAEPSKKKVLEKYTGSLKEFVPIKNYPNYLISKKGEIYCFYTQNLMTGFLLNGYHKVALRKDGNRNQFCVHRLVAIQFLENPNKYTIVNHLNGKKLDNRVQNLEWTTPKGNRIHAQEYGLIKPPSNIMPLLQYTLKNKLIQEFESITAASEQTEISISSISNMLNGHSKTTQWKAKKTKCYWVYKMPEKAVKYKRKLVPVNQIDKDTDEIVYEWDDIEEAAKYYEININDIRRVCRAAKGISNGKYKQQTTGGYKWEFA